MDMAKMNSLRDFIPFEYALLDTYRDLGVSENELAVLLMLDHLVKLRNPVLNSDSLALKMSLKSDEIDAILASLFSRKFIAYGKEGGQSTLSVEPAKERAYARLRAAVAEQDGTSKNERRAEELNSFFEDRLERTLSPLERSSISRFLEMGFRDDEVKNALLDCIRDGKSSLKAVERRLIAQRQSDDRLSEGASAVSHLSAEPIGDRLRKDEAKFEK